MLCTPCPWNTTCPCGVQQMTGPTCVVPPAWVSLPLSLSLSLSLRSGRVLTPFLLGMLSSPRLPLRVPGHGYPRRSAVSWHGHGSHGDLLASWHPSSYENRREEGRERKREKERERETGGRARLAGDRVGRAEIRLRGSRARPPWSFYYRDLRRWVMGG